MISSKRISALTTRNIKEILRDPLSLIFMFGLPVAMLILFYLIFHKLTPQFEMISLAPAMVPFGQSFAVLFTGMLIASDRASSFMTRLFTTETKPSEFIIGYMVSMIPVSLAQTALFLIVAGIIDFSFFSPFMLLGVVMSVFTAIFFISAGLLFGVITNEKAVGGVASGVVTCQSILSGMWFPPEGLSATFLTIMKVLPFKNASLLMQNVLMGDFSFEGVWLPVIIILLYSAAIFAVSVLVYKKKMKG